MRRRFRHGARAEHLARAAEAAERLWRPPLVIAAVVFALSGPTHAFGKTDAVFYASLAGLSLGGFAVPVGLLALRAGGHRKEQP